MSYRGFALAFACALTLSYPGVRVGASPAAPPLKWSPCDDTPKAECAWLQVPIDHARPNGPKIALRLGRVPARDPAHKKGVLIFIPGGPGVGIAYTFGGARASQHIDELSQSWEVVTFDPRGVGKSSPVRCSPQAVPSPPVPSLKPPGKTYYDTVARENSAFFKSCFALTGELMSHLSSMDTADDLEQIRRALTPSVGLVAYGGSYGSAYGQAYLERYPTHVKALVLDAIIDHSIDLPTFVARNVRSVDDEFDRLTRWCRAAPSCALHASGAGGAYDAVMAAHPAFLPIVSQLMAAGSDPEYGWPGIAKMLAAAKAGDTAAFDEIIKSMSIASTSVDPDERAGKNGLFPGVMCADYGPQTDIGALIAGGRAISAETPRFAWKYWGYTPVVSASMGVGACVGWPLPARYPPHRLRVGMHRNVMIANPTHDPPTGLANAVSVWTQIPQARLLIADADGHQSWIVSKCAFQQEERFLSDPQSFPSVTLCPEEPQPQP